jgi:hypothetical protein
VVTNQYGTYTVEDPNVYTILNHPIEQVLAPTTTATTTTTGTAPVPTTTATTSAPLSTSTPAPTTTASTVEMRVDIGSDTSLDGTVSVRTFVSGATSIRLFTRPRSTAGATFTPVGYASFHGDNEWRFEWDTTKVPNGSYDLKVQAIQGDASSVTRTIIANIDNETPDTTPTTTTTVIASTEQAPITQPLEPLITITVAKESPISGDAEIYVNVPLATYVELYAVQSTMLTPRFIGLANKQNDTMWRYRLDSLQLPNGTYELFAKVRHAYGDSISTRIKFSVKNLVESEKTVEQVAYVDTLKTVSTELQIGSTEPLPPAPEILKNETLITTNETNPAPSFESASDEKQSIISALLNEFYEKAKVLMTAYALAVRSGDENKRTEIKNQMLSLEKDILSRLPDSAANEDIEGSMHEYITSYNNEIRERVERSETLIKERVGDAITKDTDKDGLSDYDEVSIYKTDPFVADTDDDGYIDGAEILSGYNPIDAKPEASIRYESPRDTGVVREDLLTVTTIEGLSPTVEEPQRESQSAMITGTGLPSSFVTLYIFSTPIIVTVKTDTEGNWSYIFDKELDDGAHEVYVGITDNAGKIVAKSNPLAFVKTAEAFSPIDAGASAVATTESENPSLLSGNAMLVVGSIAVVALGLVLILLGLHVRPREQELVAAH